VGILGQVSDRLGTRKLDPRLVWRSKARTDQLLPEGDGWRVVYWQGGRGSGKTASGAGGMADWVLADTDGDGEYGIVGPTYADAWTKCVEGEAGILRALGTSMKEVKEHRSRTVRSAWRTYGQVVLHNGVTIFIDSAAEGGLRIQGRNLKGLWADEIGLWEKWETAWDESIKYAVRKGRAQIIATGTPKASRPARRLVRRLIRNEPEEGGVIVRRLRTVDNAANLSPAFYRAVIGAAKGTRLERQELEGELLDDVANALWTRSLIENIQCPGYRQEGGPQHLRRCYIGVDPSDGNEASDEQAYTVAGLGPVEDGHIYVVENWGGQEAPAAFARRVILKAAEYDATIVVEKNHGGRWLTTVFQQVMKEMVREGVFGEHSRRPPVDTIHASDSKRTRAEPVSGLYERYGGTLVQHCGRETWSKVTDPDTGEVTRHCHREGMIELEDQMATFTGAQGEKSPDRLDSLVWALSGYLNTDFGRPVSATYRKWALAEGLELIGKDQWQVLRERRLASAHGGMYGDQGWDLDSFAPGADEEDQDAPAQRGPRRNHHEWR
jgi:phage terminase large subunit-like protein